MPKLSVIVPVYNAETYLERCINSILTQTFPDFELLLIDDGSKDSSPLICDKYAQNDKRIKVIHKPNEGVSSARNHGIEIATADWITFIDADDFISPNYFASIENQDADILIFRNERLQINGSTYITYEVPSSERNVYDNYSNIITHYLIHPVVKVPWAKIIKRERIGELRFITGQPIGEDTEFIYRLLAKCNSIEVLNNNTYYWQDNDKQNDAKKYEQPPEKAAEYVSNIYKAYRSLSTRQISVEAFLINFFFNLCKRNKTNRYKSWFANDAVKEMNEYIKKTDMSLCGDYYWFYERHIIVQYLLELKWRIGNIARKIKYHLLFK